MCVCVCVCVCGVEGVMITIEGKRKSDSSSNLNKAVCISHNPDTVWKSMNSTILSPSTSK